MVISDKAPTTNSKDKTKINILCKPFSLNQTAHRVYTTHRKAMTVANLVEIRSFIQTGYVNSLILSLKVYQCKKGCHNIIASL